MALLPANEGFQRTFTERLLISARLTSRGGSGISEKNNATKIGKTVLESIIGNKKAWNQIDWRLDYWWERFRKEREWKEGMKTCRAVKESSDSSSKLNIALIVVASNSATNANCDPIDRH